MAHFQNVLPQGPISDQLQEIVTEDGVAEEAGTREEEVVLLEEVFLKPSFVVQFNLLVLREDHNQRDRLLRIMLAEERL